MICNFDVPFLLLYTHIPALIIAFFVGVFVYLQDRKNLVNKTFFVFTLLFCFWVVDTLFQWYTHDVAWNLFFSQISVLYTVSLLVFVYFIHAFTGSKISRKKQILFFVPFVPIVLLMHTPYNLTINQSDCSTETGPLYIYVIGVVLFYVVDIVSILLKQYQVSNEKIKSQIKILVAAISFFIIWFLGLSFAIDSAVSYGYGDELSQIMPLGMVVFLGLVTYAMTKHNLFNAKLITANVITVIILVMIGTLFFLLEPSNILGKIFVAITFIIAVAFGIMLIRSVRDEVERKEELEKLSRSLAIANDRLEELDKQKSEFISIASHQLRTPLTAIRGYISLALEGSYGKMDNPEITDLFHKIYTIDLRLSQLVEDLLNVSKIEAGKVQYKWDETSLEPVVRELYDMFIALAKKKGLSIAYEEPKTPLPTMTLDINKIKEIISNLIDNAIKYTEKGGVTISIEATETLARVVIADTGIGISKEDAERLFGKFIRTETTKKMDTGGSGLGLFVGKTFVEAHGGRVYAESDGVGKGSRFIVELPFINPNKNL